MRTGYNIKLDGLGSPHWKGNVWAKTVAVALSLDQAWWTTGKLINPK